MMTVHKEASSGNQELEINIPTMCVNIRQRHHSPTSDHTVTPKQKILIQSLNSDHLRKFLSGYNSCCSLYIRQKCLKKLFIKSFLIILAYIPLNLSQFQHIYPYNILYYVYICT